MKDQQPVDLKKLVAEAQTSQVGQKDLSIWGGRCTEKDLLPFLESWSKQAQMPYRIWEYVSGIVFEKEKSPSAKDVVLLQRGRLFGEGGDLEVRRDGAEFSWRFVGPAGVQPPGGYSAKDYWASHHNVEDVTYFQDEATALLWGEWEEKKEKWHDDRVGAADLKYPTSGKRVQVHYKTFSRGGRIAFVWYTGLSEWKEEDNG